MITLASFVAVYMIIVEFTKDNVCQIGQPKVYEMFKYEDSCYLEPLLLHLFYLYALLVHSFHD